MINDGLPEAGTASDRIVPAMRTVEPSAATGTNIEANLPSERSFDCFVSLAGACCGWGAGAWQHDIPQPTSQACWQQVIPAVALGHAVAPDAGNLIPPVMTPIAISGTSRNRVVREKVFMAQNYTRETGKKFDRFPKNFGRSFRQFATTRIEHLFHTPPAEGCCEPKV